MSLSNTYNSDITEKWSYPINPQFINSKWRKEYQEYRSKLFGLYERADMTGVMEASEDQPVHIRDIYVPLRLDKTNIDYIKSTEEVDDIKGLTIEDTLCSRQFTAISGLPGSGKSTLTKFLATALSQTENNHYTNQLGRRIVIPFTLRELNFSKINSLDDLWNEWLADFSKRLELELKKEFFDFYISYGWAVIIFDGIDEIKDEKNRELIEWINNWINENIETLITAPNKLNIIITGRPYGYLDDGEYEKYFDKMFLQPFNSKEIEIYTHKWFSIRHPKDKVRIEQKTNDFVSAIKDYGLTDLKHRPIYLAMLAYVAETYGELPRTRSIAYSKMIDAYVHQLDLIKRLKDIKTISREIWSYDDKIRVLEELAYKIHAKATEELESEKNNDARQMQIQVTIDTLKQYIEKILKDEKLKSIHKDEIEQFVDYLLARTGLIVEPRHGYVQFSHLSFQEYLVAARIYRRKNPLKLIQYLKTEIFERLNKTGWYEVGLLYFGIDSLRAGEYQSDILKEVIERDNGTHHKFIIDLFATTEHKLSEDEELRWLKTLIYVWSLFGGQRNLFKYMSETVKKRFTEEIYNNIISYLFSFADKVINGNASLYDEDSLIAQNNDDEKSNSMCCNLDKHDNNILKAVRNLFLLGIYWKSFRADFLTKERIKKLSIVISSIETTTKEYNIDIAVILDKYLSFIDEQNASSLSETIFFITSFKNYHLSFGNPLYYPYHFNNRPIHNAFIELFVVFNMSLLFAVNSKSPSQIFMNIHEYLARAFAVNRK